MKLEKGLVNNTDRLGLTRGSVLLAFLTSNTVFANMRRVGKGFSGVETRLFGGMLVAGVIEEEGDVVQDQSIPSPTLPTPPPQQPQDLPSTSQVQHTLPQSPQPQPQSQHQAQQQAADFSMSLLQEALDACDALTRIVEHLEYDKVAQALEITKLKRRVKKLEKANRVKVLKLRRLKKVGTSQRIDTSDDTVMEDASNQGRMIDALDSDAGVALIDDKEEEKKAEEAKVFGDDQVQGRQAEIYQIDMDHASKVLSMQEDEPAEVHEVVDVVTTTKLITEVVTDASESVTTASTTISAAEPQVFAATITAVPSKDKGKGIMVEEPKPLKKKQQVEMDEEYARKLYEELNKDIDWNVAIDHVKKKAKEDPFVQRYQVMKKRPQTEAQARKNMIMYLKNVAGFRLDYFKGMPYDDIRPIFKAKFNSNIEFLLNIKEQLKEEGNRVIQRLEEEIPHKLLEDTKFPLSGFGSYPRRVEHLEYYKVTQDLEITKLKRRVKKLEKANRVKVLKLRRLKKVGTSHRIDTSDDTVMEDASNQGRMIDALDSDAGIALMDDKEEEKKAEEAKVAGDDQVQGRQAEMYQIDIDHALKVLSMQEDEPVKVQEVVDVVTTAKLITEVVTAGSELVTTASTTISAAEPHVPPATITAVPVRVAAASTRRRKGVVIRDPEEESTTIIPVDTKSKDKGKGIMVEERKPLKKKQQVKMDEEYARKLHEELNKDIDSNVVIDHVKQKAKEDPFVQRYQVIKKRPQTEAQARKNMIMYLKNVAGFRLDYFKGMSYDDIRPIFEAKFNSFIEFLLKIKEELKEKQNRAIQSINKTPAQKAAKRRKLKILKGI
uniref:Uncharacterized protein n=1 Tax=Tanacetum cinerariifolium TaxID=118510 RepID=A0A6L2KCQ9_TANCI|nr:hypothetical protein [Tanacetum cinerariifolium]